MTSQLPHHTGAPFAVSSPQVALAAEHGAGRSQLFGVTTPQSAPLVQSPQNTSPTNPQSMLAHSGGTSHRPAVTAPQTSGRPQVHSVVPPQPSSRLPHVPGGQVVSASQSHRPGVCRPQVCGGVQSQLTLSPQPSSKLPHCLGKSSQVFGVQTQRASSPAPTHIPRVHAQVSVPPQPSA